MRTAIVAGTFAMVLCASANAAPVWYENFEGGLAGWNIWTERGTNMCTANAEGPPALGDPINTPLDMPNQVWAQVGGGDTFNGGIWTMVSGLPTGTVLHIDGYWRTLAWGANNHWAEVIVNDNQAEVPVNGADYPATTTLEYKIDGWDNPAGKDGMFSDPDVTVVNDGNFMTTDGTILVVLKVGNAGGLTWVAFDDLFITTPGGVITEIIDATGDGAGNALDNPYGIAVDSVGNAYVTGANTDNAFKITPTGAITEIIDATGDGAGHGLDYAWGVAVDGASNAYVTGGNTHSAFKITPAGVITQIIDATGDGVGHGLHTPYGIAVDGAGNAYVAGRSSNNAFKITPGGVITQIIDSTGDGAGHGLNAPYCIAVDGEGNAYVTGLNSDNAFKITAAGGITQIIDAAGDGAGHGLDGTYGIAVDAVGNAYVTGYASHNAFKITPAGVITQIIDATGDGAGHGLDTPYGIAVDSAGNAYVVGYSTNNAFKITPAGVITQIIDASGDGAGNALSGSRAIAVNGEANAYMTGQASDNAFEIGPPDCNNNGIPDDQEIAGGTSADCNANGVPDECEAILYVDDSATGLNGGTSWADAYLDLQDALAEANANCAVSEIWVAAGTYKPEPDGGTGNPDLSFEMVDGVALYGGFAGGETDLSQRPLDPDPFTIDPAVDSVLSGDIGVSGDPSDNSYHVVKADNISSNGILDGFTVTAGYAFGWGPDSHGGGMVIGGDPTVVNCTFRGNKAGFGYGDGYGGGMYISTGSPTVVNCTFSNNEAYHDGGGMYIYGGDPTVVNCTFSNNEAYHDGGGMYNKYGDTTVVNCTSWLNSAGSLGNGMYTYTGGEPTVTNCILWDAADAIWTDDPMVPVVTYSNVAGGWPGEGNIDLDPMFADAPNGDLRLLPGSPCIDAANNLALPADIADLDGDGDTSEPIPFDLDGNPRRLDDPDTPDTGYGVSPIVDMGAY
ncbi:MAG: SBBP repeat-containing protein, partial [Phycisphaerales bacterium]